jgi:perosamine synthetase
VGWRIYPRHRLDLGAGHLFRALAYCMFPARAEPDRDGAISCASVRSGLELVLEALQLEPNTEVVVSAITHPDMVRILERHRLVAVPVDIDLETLAPIPAALDAAVGDRTGAILVAHLFGGRVDLTHVLALASERGLIVLEDCAQSLRGPDDRGDEAADVSLFSFGSIKTCPALGGAILHVRRPDLLAKMRALQSSWPRQPRAEYAARVVRFFGLCALQNPVIYGAFVRLAAIAGIDSDRLVNRAVHALRPPAGDETDEFERWLRRRPSPSLLALLRHRLRRFDASRLARRAALGQELAASLPERLSNPGGAALDRTHWVFPVMAEEPAALISALRGAGFDATRATTSIAAVGSPAPRGAAELMERVVFVPAYPELPRSAVERLKRVLQEAA